MAYDGNLAKQASCRFPPSCMATGSEPSFQLLADATEAEPPGLLSIGRTELGRGLVVQHVSSKPMTAMQNGLPMRDA